MSQLMDLKDQARLELTLATRENIIKSMVSNGKLPADVEDRDFLMKALDGLDRTVLAKTKLKIEDKNAQTQQNTARMIGDILKRTQIRNNSIRTNSPILDNEFVIEDKIDGEDEIGVSTLTYEQFTSGNIS